MLSWWLGHAHHATTEGWVRSSRITGSARSDTRPQATSVVTGSRSRQVSGGSFPRVGDTAPTQGGTVLVATVDDDPGGKHRQRISANRVSWLESQPHASRAWAEDISGAGPSQRGAIGSSCPGGRIAQC